MHVQLNDRLENVMHVQMMFVHVWLAKLMMFVHV